MGKQTKKKKSTGAAKEIFAKPPGRLGKWNVIAFVVLVIGELIYYYAATPAINIQSTSFWVWMVISVALVGFCTLDFTVESNDTRSVATKATKPAAWIVVIMSSGRTHYGGGVIQAVLCIKVCKSHQYRGWGLPDGYPGEQADK